MRQSPRRAKRAFGPPRRVPGGPRRRERRARARDARSVT
jgi:hypothetical protein